ncbi:MAG TPA: TonB-dependent receptor [Longimicrobiaceae bacterium]|nr:TonB-dependent receptor [Longimicrobiaceae bacterium]
MTRFSYVPHGPFPGAPPRNQALRPGPVLFLLAALLCFAVPLRAQERGTVTGTVTNVEGGTPVANVVVRVSGAQQSSATGENGGYTLRLAPGTYELVASRLGEVLGRAQVTVAAGQTVTRDFQVRPGEGLAIDALVVVGSRRPDRSVLSAPVPVDVVTSEEIQQTGLTETAQIIQRLAPSVNFPRATIADGTDHVRPATLRGLAPDQVLVLLNGKRRHNSALVNVNGTIGRGSTAVDLNAIPPSAIERIEILREGAAAQYGSDAIAGVINIVLRSGGGARLASTVGQTAEGDGEVVQVGAGWGRDIGEQGYLNVTGDFRDRGFTNRSYPDTRPQYLTGDPRNNDPNLTNRINHRQGDAATTDAGMFLNAGLPLGGVQAYGFGGVTRREGEAAGFFRRALDDRTVRALHPNGFLPLIVTDIWDGSGAGGVRGTFAGWSWDLSSVYGRNTFEFDVHNSNNVTLGAASPTEFYAGTLGFSQSTSNLDLVRQFAIGLASPLNVAAGAELRREAYWIDEGEPDSYRDGGVRILDGPNAGRQGQIGAQVFPGFRPTDARDESRRSVAGYLDLEANLTPGLLVTLAGRVEDYSDFGSTSDGRVAARFEPVPWLAFRGSAGTGFRAPSLAQSHFSSTATNFIVVGGVNTPFEVRTLPVASAEAKVLGAQPLKPEESVNLSAGVTFNPIPALAATVDFYQIDVDDRIVLSGNFLVSNPQIRALFESAGLRGVGGGRFFTNAIDTRTRGVDVVVNYGVRLGESSRLRLTGSYNHNETEITDIAPTPPQLAGLQETLFDRVERARIEVGQPRDNLGLTLNYSLGGLGVNLHNQRFGEVTQFALAADGSQDQTFGAKWITDLELSYRLRNGISLALGGNNIFDVYPDEWKDFDARGPLSNVGIFRYSGISPFGFNGAFYYARVSLEM